MDLVMPLLKTATTRREKRQATTTVVESGRVPRPHTNWKAWDQQIAEDVKSGNFDDFFAEIDACRATADRKRLSEV